MTMIDRLLKRLHRVFNKDPNGTAAISVEAAEIEATITIRDNTLTIATALDSFEISLVDKTIAEIVDAVNTWSATGFREQIFVSDGEGGLEQYLSNDLEKILVLPGDGDGPITVAVADAALAGYTAWGLLDMPSQPLVAGLQFPYPTSLFYNEMQVYAMALKNQAGRLTDLEKQMYFHSADGSWLDFWGRDMFGIVRYNDETDTQYQMRVLNEITAPNQNNVALAMIIKNALGVDARILDAVPHIDELPPEQQGDAVGRFLLDLSIDSSLATEQVEELITKTQDLVRRFKAAGTGFLQAALRKQVALSESATVSEAFNLNISAAMADELGPGPIFVGAGWVVGTPGLLVGNNDALKEQCVVTVLDTDETIVSRDYYGG